MRTPHTVCADSVCSVRIPHTVRVESAYSAWIRTEHMGECKVLVVCLHRITHMLRDSTRDNNILTFVRFVSCFMIRDHEDNAYSFLRHGRQFLGEFGDPIEVEAVGWRDSHLEQDSDILEDVQWFPWLMKEESSIDSETLRPPSE